MGTPSPGLLKTALVLVLSWVFLTGILIVVGFGVTHSTGVNELDRHVTSVVVAHRTPTLDSVMKVVTWLGSWVALAATGILLVVLVFLRRLSVVVAFVAWAGDSGGVSLAKHVVHRSRPPSELRLVSAHGWSWPSGHTATATAIVVFATLALIVTGIVSNAAYQAFAWVLAALVVAAVAFSRIELGVHWSTDVIASTIFVAAWLVALSTLFTTEIRPKKMGREDPGNVRPVPR